MIWRHVVFAVALIYPADAEDYERSECPQAYPYVYSGFGIDDTCCEVEPMIDEDGVKWGCSDGATHCPSPPCGDYVIERSECPQAYPYVYSDFGIDDTCCEVEPMIDEDGVKWGCSDGATHCPSPPC